DFPGAPVADTWYAAALANHKSGADLDGATSEINARFNTDVDNGTVLGSTNWYYGTDGMPGGDIDLVTVAMHEIGHGIGFFSLMNCATGAYSMQGLPGIYDRFLNNARTGGTKLTALTNAQRLAAITSNDLWWDGPKGTAGNSGTRPRIFAPNPFQPGSSLSH